MLETLLIELGVKLDAAAITGLLEAVPAKGLRSHGEVTLCGWPQIREVNTQDAEPLKHQMLVIGQLMDGRLVVLELKDLSVGYIDQQDPEYPAVLAETYVNVAPSLKAYVDALAAGSPDLPTDYEQALRRVGRRFRWDDEEGQTM